MVGLPVRCRQLVHEVRPDLFVITRSIHRQGGNLGLPIVLVISVMWILQPITHKRHNLDSHYEGHAPCTAAVNDPCSSEGVEASLHSHGSYSHSCRSYPPSRSCLDRSYLPRRLPPQPHSYTASAGPGVMGPGEDCNTPDPGLALHHPCSCLRSHACYTPLRQKQPVTCSGKSFP